MAPIKTRFAVEKALEWFRDDPSLSFKAVDEALGYHTNACSKWYAANTCGFRDAYDELLKAEFAALEGPAIKCMADLIEGRSFQAAKYVLDHKGYKAPERIEASVDTNITISVEDD